jgi:hypothetical protein
MVPKFQVATACFSCSPPNFKLIKTIPCCGCHQINCPNYRKCKLKIRNSGLLEATSYHLKVFTFTLFWSEGRAGIAWEPSNKLMLFPPPPKLKCLSLLPLYFLFTSTLYLSFLSLSLSLGRLLPDCWLVVSMCPEGSATGHLDTSSLRFPLSSNKYCWRSWSSG